MNAIKTNSSNNESISIVQNDVFQYPVLFHHPHPYPHPPSDGGALSSSPQARLNSTSPSFGNFLFGAHISHTYTHTYTHTHIYTYTHTHIHTYTHTHIYTYTHIYIHTYTHTYTHIYIHTYTHTHIHTYTHIYIHTYTHTHIHTYTHTYTHTHLPDNMSSSVAHDAFYVEMLLPLLISENAISFAFPSIVPTLSNSLSMVPLTSIIYVVFVLPEHTFPSTNAITDLFSVTYTSFRAHDMRICVISLPHLNSYRSRQMEKHSSLHIISRIPSPSPSPSPAICSNENGSFTEKPTSSCVVLGGTFDHLHAGHRVLLSAAVWQLMQNHGSYEGELLIGLTCDEMLSKKKFAEQLQSYDERKTVLTEFVSSCVDDEKNFQLHIEPLHDQFGPALYERCQTLIVSKETESGGKLVNDRRLLEGKLDANHHHHHHHHQFHTMMMPPIPTLIPLLKSGRQTRTPCCHR